jgi:drug/metabolite transporter (DMT)-like permease
LVAIILALASAISYGGSDFAAGLASRSADVIRVILIASLAGLAVILVAFPLAASHRPSAAAVIWGVVVGLSGTVGALALYLGFRHAAFSVAATLSAVGAAGFSVLAGLLLGERPTALALIGIALALPAIAGVSASAGGPEAEEAAGASPPSPGKSAITGRRWVPAGVSYGLVAGACFALLFIGLNQAGSGSGLWPVFCSQVAALLAVGCVAAFTGNLRLPEARGGRPAAVAGLTGGPGTICFFIATHHGLLAVTAVITSLYPAVTIMLARVMLGERLTAIRLAGLSLAAASVALIAAGGAGAG